MSKKSRTSKKAERNFFFEVAASRMRDASQALVKAGIAPIVIHHPDGPKLLIRKIRTA